MPLDWATTQHNLGDALSAWGKQESGTERLEQAVAGYRAALAEYSRARDSIRWAMGHYSLGNVLWTLAERESGTGCIDLAIMAYQAALEVLAANGSPGLLSRAESRLARALKMRRDRG